MRWASASLGAVLALSGYAQASQASNMAAGSLIGALFQRNQDVQNETAAAVLEGRQSAGRCGADQGNAKCPSDQCCSQWGYCGVGAEFCNPIALCQSAFGSCLGSSPTPVPTSSSSSSSSAAAPPTTTTTPPVVTSSSTTTSTTARPTTSSSSTTPPATATSSSSAAAPPTSTPVQPGPGGALVPSVNGMCGNSTTCAGSTHGSCCSEFFWCGDGAAFCGTGCQPKFGMCFGVVAPPAPPPVRSSSSAAAVPPASSATSARPSTTSSAAASPSATSSASASASASATASSASSAAAPSASTLPAGVSVTTDGSCGGGRTCTGSTFGKCCSQFGFCGDGDQFCSYMTACQSQWGTCDPAPAGASVS